MQTELEKLVSQYRELGIDRQIDYDKFYLYSLITHSTAIEGSTITELENQIMFDQGISLKGKSIEEQNMNLDLKIAYEKAKQLADAHYDLVTIHLWADGNGRMARLLMNQLQFEFGLIPAKILKEDKEEYIKALVATRENDDLNIFRDFMTSTMIKNLTHEIDVYRKSVEKDLESREKPQKGREKIIALLSQDNTLSAAALAERIGITPKAVEKQISRLKADGVIKRIGPDKGGYWQILKKL